MRETFDLTIHIPVEMTREVSSKDAIYTARIRIPIELATRISEDRIIDQLNKVFKKVTTKEIDCER